MRNVKKHKICRRLGTPVFEQCTNVNLTPKRQTRRPRARSEYGEQMLDKQRVRFTYGLRERQFANYIREASATSHPSEALYRILELRLDNVVYRLGFAPTRAAARQAVSHGHILVNGRKMDIPSHRLRPGDEISVKEGSKEAGMFLGLSERLKDHTPPTWLTLDEKRYTGRVDVLPKLGESDALFNLTAVLEFYSR